MARAVCNTQQLQEAEKKLAMMQRCKTTSATPCEVRTLLIASEKKAGLSWSRRQLAKVAKLTRMAVARQTKLAKSATHERQAAQVLYRRMEKSKSLLKQLDKANAKLLKEKREVSRLVGPLQ